VHKSNLELAIEYYESELALLKELLREDLEGSNYKAADLHKTAIDFTENKLITLRLLKDPFYLERNYLESEKKYFENSLQEDERLIDVVLDEILEINNKLKKINTGSKFQEDTQYIDDAFYDLIDGKIRSFKLLLGRVTEFSFSMAKGNIIEIKIHNVGKKNGEIWQNRVLRSLIGIGFQYGEGNDLARYNYEITKQGSIGFKTLLSRIIFDILYYEPGNPASLLILK
jgi:hypothetical protein